jgi:hypothetical protein
MICRSWVGALPAEKIFTIEGEEAVGRKQSASQFTNEYEREADFERVQAFVKIVA